MSKIEVKCGKCGRKFWMEDYESKACPNCGRVAVGPKVKSGSSGGCFITTACVEASGLPDNCIELETMRYLRDEYLARSEEGKRMINEYYEIAPSIVTAIRTRENSNEIFNNIFNEIGEIVWLVKIHDLEGAMAHCREMMLRLEKEYLEI